MERKWGVVRSLSFRVDELDGKGLDVVLPLAFLHNKEVLLLLLLI